MKYWKSALIFLIALLIQPTLLNYIIPGSMSPNLLMTLTIAFGYLYYDEYHGIIFGSLSGILYDIFLGQTIGETAIPLAVCAIVGYVYARISYKYTFVSFLVCNIIGTVLYYITQYIILASQDYALAFTDVLLKILLYWLITLPVTLILFILLNRKAAKRERRYY